MQETKDKEINITPSTASSRTLSIASEHIEHLAYSREDCPVGDGCAAFVGDGNNSLSSLLDLEDDLGRVMDGNLREDIQIIIDGIDKVLGSSTKSSDFVIRGHQHMKEIGESFDTDSLELTRERGVRNRASRSKIPQDDILEDGSFGSDVYVALKEPSPEPSPMRRKKRFLSLRIRDESKGSEFLATTF